MVIQKLIINQDMYKKSDHEYFQIYSSKYLGTLRSALMFEIRSCIGRIFQNKKLLKQKKIQLLNLGCGHSIYKGWVNSDFYNGLIFWNRRMVKDIWMQDFRYALNCLDDHWDGVFMEHTLEHMYPNQAIFLLKEIKRTLKVNGWLRISVPDLDKYVKFYVNKKNKDFKKYWQIGASAMWSLTQNWGHHSVWNYELLELNLKDIGFRKIRKVGYRKGTFKAIIKDNINRKWESLYVEAQK